MTTPTLVSIQVGLPAEHGADAISKKSWQSGIFKVKVEGRVFLDTLNLAGDGQADLRVHGGEYRAVLAYGAAHYPVWRQELGIPDFPYGAFGENFTVSGVDEEAVCLGDLVEVGEARLQISQLRMPCWKLARRNGIKDLAARVEATGWGGWYHRVLQTGFVEAGNAYTLIERPYPQFSIKLLNDLVNGRVVDKALSAAVAACEALTPSYRQMYADLAAA